MSREIKFAFWHKTKKEMWHVESIDWRTKEVSNGGDVASLDDGDLLQFTGLLDKNGKEIFKGDLLIFYVRVDADIDDAGQVYSCKGQVIFDNGAFIIENLEPKVRPFFYFDWDKMKIGEHCEELSVGGNLYQNPELLGGKNE